MKFFNKIKSKFSKKNKKAAKRFTKEKYQKNFKICLFTFLIFAVISAFSSSLFLGIGLIVSLLLLVAVVKRAPLPEQNVYIYCSKDSQYLDISFFPEENRKQMINVYAGFIEFFKNNNIPIPQPNQEGFEWELQTPEGVNTVESEKQEE